MADMELLAEKLIALSRALPWLRWTVFDSRRSPEAEVDHMVDWSKRAMRRSRFVRFAEGGLLSNNPALPPTWCW